MDNYFTVLQPYCHWLGMKNFCSVGRKSRELGRFNSDYCPSVHLRIGHQFTMKFSVPHPDMTVFFTNLFIRIVIGHKGHL
jgi:hypothetical protein